MPYTKYNDPWVDADSATGGGDESTPLVAAALDHIEQGVSDAVTAVEAHLADTTDAHDASAISVLDTAGNFTGDDVEEVLAELAEALAPGHEFAAQSVTADLASADDTGAWTDVVDFGSVTFDGGACWAKVFIPLLRHTVAAAVLLRLYDVTAGAAVGNVFQVDIKSGGDGMPVAHPFAVTPAAGSRNYKIQWSMTVAGTRTIRTTSLQPANFLIVKR